MKPRSLLTALVILSFVALQSPVALCDHPDLEKSGIQEQGVDENASKPAANGKAPAKVKQPQPVDKVRRSVDRIGIGNQITVFRHAGNDLHGTVSRIHDETFEVAEIDMRSTFTVRYDEVKKIRSGYGGMNLFTGKRVSHPKAVKIAAIGGLLFLIIGLPVIALSGSGG